MQEHPWIRHGLKQHLMVILLRQFMLFDSAMGFVLLMIQDAQNSRISYVSGLVTGSTDVLTMNHLWSSYLEGHKSDLYISQSLTDDYGQSNTF